MCRLPERCGSFVHTASGRLLLGLAKRLVLAELPDAQAVGEIALQAHELVAVEPGLASTRVNDGRCDRAGRFVFGTLNEDPGRAPIGSFYQYASTQGLRRLDLPGVAIANSLCFSLDGRTLYGCDTLTRRIFQCDYDSEDARVGAPREFVHKASGEGWPDGSVIDAEGCLWNAEWGGAAVARYAPDGRLLQRLKVPVPNPSCPALGGPRLDQLLVTTARQELDAAQLRDFPLSGSLFGTTLGPGLQVPETLFED